MSFKNFYTKLTEVGDSLQSLFLLGVRLFWGYQIFKQGGGSFFTSIK